MCITTWLLRSCACAHAQVLTFEGYFKEAVVESSTESFRIRRVVFKYYVEDDTCLVTEIKVENSGMDQGPFIKRHALPKAGGGFLHWTDFTIGEDVLVYGRVFRITAVDEFTRVRGWMGRTHVPAQTHTHTPSPTGRAALFLFKHSRALGWLADVLLGQR
jgi:hypothetical protein